MPLAPFEDRLTSSVSKKLGTTAQFHHWIKKPTGDVPVFAVPKSAIAKAKDLGLTVVELMMNQRVLTFGSFISESVGYADDGARIGEDHMSDLIAAAKLKKSKKKEKDKWIHAFGEDDTASLWPGRNGDQIKEEPHAGSSVNIPRYDVGARYDVGPNVANPARKADFQKKIQAANQELATAPTEGAKQSIRTRIDGLRNQLERLQMQESEMVNSELELVQQQLGQFKAETRGRMLNADEWTTLLNLERRLRACQMGEQSLGTGGYSTGAPEYKTGKSPITEYSQEDIPKDKRCTWCDGEGVDSDDNECKGCHGSGYKKGMKHIKHIKEAAQTPANPKTGKSNYDKWTKQHPITKTSNTYFGITEIAKDFPELGEIREGDVTGSEGSLYGGPTGSIGEDKKDRRMVAKQALNANKIKQSPFATLGRNPTTIAQDIKAFASNALATQLSVARPIKECPCHGLEECPDDTVNGIDKDMTHSPFTRNESDLGLTAGVVGQSSPVNFTQFKEGKFGAKTNKNLPKFPSRFTKLKPVKETATWGADVGSAFEAFDGTGKKTRTRVPPHPTDEDTEGLMISGTSRETMKEAAGSFKGLSRNRFFRDLVQNHKGLPVRYRDSGDDFTAESTDKATLQTIADFAHEQGLRTSIKKSVYEWSETLILTITGFKG